MRNKDIINVAVIAHVDAGKSTLVDALLAQSGVFSENEVVVEQVMDSNDLERERGITIYSKNCAIEHNNTKINIVDTPGHADFSSEVERIMKTVDTVILLVDSSEGPMPQTRVVLQKSLEQGLRPILFINKIDKKDQRAEEVVDLSFDLFVELGATDEQLDFPIIYGVARDGIAMREMDEDSHDLTPLFDLIISHVAPYPDNSAEPLQLQVSSLGYDDYVGRLGIGRISRGTLHAGEIVTVSKRDGTSVQTKIAKLYVNEGLSKVEKDIVYAGDIVTFSGISHISIGETICDKEHVEPMDMIAIERPTLAMNFLVNDSPFVGRSGHFVTSRQIRARLHKELETNVGLEVEELDHSDGYRVSGRGELHLSILLENMRREGYELSVSKPEVLFIKQNDQTLEPFEKVIVSAPDEFIGSVIQQLNQRKGTMISMNTDGSYSMIEYLVPTRGIIGYRSEFINSTRGRGTMEKSFYSYEPYAGTIERKRNGVFIAKEKGKTMSYSLFQLSERARMCVKPSVEVYEGMIVGLNSRANDLVVNPCKNKNLTNVRSSGTDEAIKLLDPLTFTLEEALEFIEGDELVEITPDDIRLRKKILSEIDRKREYKRLSYQ
ncbi:translational GTPase TypA [Candidatus Xianfuyuplasma coldseepsis]|uniref:Large ribosomal subunit assembly factor BipA n=1 Tax=Candidatus Xianfuyuplasma coldseepsis TaxID=2782163 RepID=A0A7L7KS88_9MOLU|nr:translational GTPase TypA [Xianfuyuplasma coldseepsis]QMS85279.1 translational GTPase TypA [Xianfuyuplasma coldseepsis]